MHNQLPKAGRRRPGSRPTLGRITWPLAESLERRVLLSTVLQVGSGKSIPVNDFNWLVSASPSGPAVAGAVNVDLGPSDASPALLYAVARGTVYPEVFLIDRDSQGNEISRIDLQKATFMRYSNSGSASPAAISEQAEVSFQKVTWTYAIIGAAGIIVGMRQGTWDITAATVDGGTFSGDPQFAGNPQYVLDTGSGKMSLTGFSWGESSAGGP